LREIISGVSRTSNRNTASRQTHERTADRAKTKPFFLHSPVEDQRSLGVKSTLLQTPGRIASFQYESPEASLHDNIGHETFADQIVKDGQMHDISEQRLKARAMIATVKRQGLSIPRRKGILKVNELAAGPSSPLPRPNIQYSVAVIKNHRVQESIAKEVKTYKPHFSMRLQTYLQDLEHRATKHRKFWEDEQKMPNYRREALKFFRKHTMSNLEIELNMKKKEEQEEVREEENTLHRIAQLYKKKKYKPLQQSKQQVLYLKARKEVLSLQDKCQEERRPMIKLEVSTPRGRNILTSNGFSRSILRDAKSVPVSPNTSSEFFMTAAALPRWLQRKPEKIPSSPTKQRAKNIIMGCDELKRETLNSQSKIQESQPMLEDISALGSRLSPNTDLLDTLLLKEYDVANLPHIQRYKYKAQDHRLKPPKPLI
jgi:hypothetical protein